MKKLKVLLISFTVLTSTITTLRSEAVSEETIGVGIRLWQVNNYYPEYIPTWIEADVPLTFLFSIHNGSGFSIRIVRGLFEVYSPDGANWQPLGGDWVTTTDWSLYFDSPPGQSFFDNNGSGADTANFLAFNLSGPGLPSPFGAPAWFITTLVDSTQVGKQICIDSVKVSRFNNWLWTYELGSFIPSWTGPLCFSIEADCCQGIRGDVNGDGTDSNVLDLSYLVNRIFHGGPAAPCALEADLNGDGTSGNIIDLTYLVDYIYHGGPAGVSCP